MELRNLKAFLAAAREENITRAAEQLHITQPSLSRQIMQLEQELGVKLFQRSRHSVILTEQGRLFKRRAQEILELADKAQKELKQEDELIFGEISIGCAETKNMDALTQLMAEFQDAYPDVFFDIYTAVADDVMERMERGSLDLGLLMEPTEISSYNFLKMPFQERWCILMKKDSPLAEKKVITAADLAGQRLIFTTRKSVKNELENWLGEYYDQVYVAATSNISYYNRRLMVKNGLGVATCHEFSDVDPDLCIRLLSPEISNGSVLVWKREQVLSPAVRKFVEFAKQKLQQGDMQNVHTEE